MKTYFRCFFYPTTIICVDDDPAFLKWLKLSLEVNNQIIDFNTPHACMHFLEQNYACVATSDYLIAKQTLDQASLHAYVKKIHEKIYDADRVNEISTLMVDYHMPGIDGLSLYRSFEQTPYKKIMLTGEADQSLAVEAFNAGLIDQFVMKGQSDVIARLQALVERMQGQFFIEKSNFLIESLLKTDLHTFSYFTDFELCERLKSLLEEHAIRELYLFNETGDYLLIDHLNQLWWLSIKNTERTNALIQSAKSLFLQEPSPEAEQVYVQIASKEQLPLFILSPHLTDEIENWSAILTKPIEIKTNQDNYQILLKKDIGKALLRYTDIKLLKLD